MKKEGIDKKNKFPFQHFFFVLICFFRKKKKKWNKVLQWKNLELEPDSLFVVAFFLEEEEE